MEISLLHGLRVNAGDAPSSRILIIVRQADPVNIPYLLTRKRAAH